MLRRLWFWLSLPVSALQGLQLRRKALRLPGAAGARQGSAGAGAGETVRLLAIGDSIIDGVGAGEIGQSLPVQFAGALADRMGCCVNWRVEGRTGHSVDDVIRQLESLQMPEAPGIVLISVGVNDVTGLSSTGRWRRRLTDLFNILNRRWPESRILFAGLPPMSLFPLPPQPLRFTLGQRAAALDRIAAEVIAGFPSARHVPTQINPVDHSFCEDGFHPSAESCTIWARTLASIATRRDSDE